MARNTPKKATVAITTPVVETMSSRLGQVTCFISTRTSCRNSRACAMLPETLPPRELAASVIPPWDAPFLTFTACVAIRSSYRTGAMPAPSLAGEEGFEPPYPVLETGVLTVGRLPSIACVWGFTLQPESSRPKGKPDHQNPRLAFPPDGPHRVVPAF